MDTAPPTGTRRDRILEAALAVFLEHGLAGASIEDVCARSGASVGSVYHHFGNKEGLAGAVFAEALSRYQASFLATLEEHPSDAEQGVRAMVGNHLRWCLQERPDHARFLLFHGDAARGVTGDELLASNRVFFRRVSGWWKTHVAYGALRELDFDLAYAILLGPAQEFCRLSLTGRTTIPPSLAEPVLADGAWLALTPQGNERGAD
jgi:AcrR family transcriptional regulator